METYIVRVWVPDRPGVLGAVASRIGAVRGDVVGVDILERGAGRAIDELVVELPDESLLPLLIAEVGEVDGVDVEDVRPAASVHDARLDALESAAVLVAATTTDQLVDELVARAHHDFEADWTAVVDDDGTVLGREGPAPDGPWLAAYVRGTSASEEVRVGDAGPDDVAHAGLAPTGLAVVQGRRGRPFRSRERRQLSALAVIAGLRAADLSRPVPAAR